MMAASCKAWRGRDICKHAERTPEAGKSRQYQGNPQPGPATRPYTVIIGESLHGLQVHHQAVAFWPIPSLGESNAPSALASNHGQACKRSE